MDRPIKKKHPIIRFKYYIAGGVIFTAFLVYVIAASTGPRQFRVEADRITIAEVRQDRFLEYLNEEGTVQPIMTINLNALETGTVLRIVAEDGTMLQENDTILILQNLDLLRIIEDERDELERRRIRFNEQEIQMQRRTLELTQNTLRTEYDLRRIAREYELAKFEFDMGASSRAQLDIAEEAYRFSTVNTEMLLAMQRHDSLMNDIQINLLQNDLQRELRRFERSRERLDHLIVRAPRTGQLSFVRVLPGDRVSAGSNIGALRVIDQLKITTRISEFYIDRITIGQPATIIFQNQRFPMRISRINPEVTDRQFAVELVFVDEMPENTRIGQTFRIQIELDQPQDALVIPRGAFFQMTGGQWIFRLDETGRRATRVPVSIGRQNPQQFEILDGLSPGDRVIVSGYDHFGNAEIIVLK